MRRGTFLTAAGAAAIAGCCSERPAWDAWVGDDRGAETAEADGRSQDG